MKASETSLDETYVRLALAIEAHQPGYIDAYFGPPEWQEQAKAQGPRPLGELAAEAAGLAAAIAGRSGIDPQQLDFLAHQVKAMQTSLRLLQGAHLPLVEEVEALYDITPAWIEESVFEEAQRVLDDLLPPGDSLQERLVQREKSLEISNEQAAGLLPVILERLRALTYQRFPHPPEESFELQFVTGQPWSAYHWYLGGCASRIEVNTDLPLRLNTLTDLMAHEGYPGHHTELSLKETRLYRWAGFLSHSLALINTPSCVVSEGIATQALDILMNDTEQVVWHAEEVFPRAGMRHLDAQREHTIDQALEKLSGVGGNAAFLLHDQILAPEEVVAYVQRYRLSREDRARKLVDFIHNPLFRSYIFTYEAGHELLAALFAQRGDGDHWFTRLLTEPVTPTQIRHWILNSTSSSIISPVP